MSELFLIKQFSSELSNEQVDDSMPSSIKTEYYIDPKTEYCIDPKTAYIERARGTTLINFRY